MASQLSQGLELRCTATPLLSSLVSAGTVVGASFYGGMVTLGIIAFNNLAIRDWQSTHSTFRLALRLYIAILILAGTMAGVVNYLWENDIIIFEHNPNLVDIDAGLRTSIFGLTIFIGVITDGVLVWRCFKVQRSLTIVKSKVQQIFWIIPLSLWLVTFITGTVAVINYTYELFLPGTAETLFLTISLGSNVVLNLFATVYITTQLLLHRRIAIASGYESAKEPHLRIVEIMLESAAINIPITGVAVVGMVSGSCLSTIAMQIAVPCQSLASVLIIYQVANGEAVDEEGRSSSPKGAVDMRV